MDSEKLSAYTPHISIRVCGKEWHLERAHNLEELWDAMSAAPDDDFDDERLPYWTELWPASVALCQWLQEQRSTIAGKRCLDLGCGLGLTALVGQWLGARVLAMDYEQEALNFAALNAQHNAVPSPLWAVMDWRHPAVAAGSIDVLWGGDIMYETRFVAPVLSFLEHSLAPQGRAWVAEPGRRVYDAFRTALHQRGWNGRRVFSRVIEPLYAQPVPVTVHVWELTRR